MARPCGLTDPSSAAPSLLFTDGAPVATIGEPGGGVIFEGLYVKWSAGLIELVPFGVVTLTSATPEPAGEVAVICVGPTTEKLAAEVAPNLTALAPVKSVPVIVTLVAPAAGPDDGLTRVTVGGGTNVNRSAGLVALVPPGVVTSTSCAPALPAGDTATICVGEIGVTTAALDPPNFTALGLARFVPLIVTTVPPSVGPDAGLMPLTAGGAAYV